MNAKQLNYLIEETLTAINELECLTGGSEACEHLNCVLDMLLYQKAKIKIPEELR